MRLQEKAVETTKQRGSRLVCYKRIVSVPAVWDPSPTPIITWQYGLRQGIDDVIRTISMYFVVFSETPNAKYTYCKISTMLPSIPSLCTGICPANPLHYSPDDLDRAGLIRMGRIFKVIRRKQLTFLSLSLSLFSAPNAHHHSPINKVKFTLEPALKCV
jgi:hypothetical protein